MINLSICENLTGIRGMDFDLEGGKKEKKLLKNNRKSHRCGWIWVYMGSVIT